MCVRFSIEIFSCCCNAYCSNLYNQVYRNWAENVIITTVEETETFTKACPKVKSKLASLSIEWLTETCLALESYSNPTATLTVMWSVMRLVCRCGTDDCLEVVRKMTQELIGKCVITHLYSWCRKCIITCCSVPVQY